MGLKDLVFVPASILESTVTAFAKKSLDVTDGILKAMGVDPKNAKGRDKNESK